MGNSASALPYTIGKQIGPANVDGWALLDGSRKADGATVTVFQAKKPALLKLSGIGDKQQKRLSGGLNLLAPALHHFVHCKKLRHPHILQVYATLDTDNPNESISTASPVTATTAATAAASTTAPKAASESGDLIIVTEPCIPLLDWLHQTPPPEPELLAWGLESIVRGLHFLHASANLSHGNLSPASFMVTPAGEVKLWNFSLVTTLDNGNFSRHFLDYEAVVTPPAYRSPERLEGRWDAIATAGIHCMDSYGLAVLMDVIFSGHIPMVLQKAVQRMQTTNLKMRPRLQPLLKCPIFDTPYQKLQLQLEEITVQPVEQKIHFWQTVTPNMQAGLIPKKLARYKLLPLIQTSITTICQSDSIRSQDMYRREVLSMLAPMFFIIENFVENDKMAKELTSIVTLLFTVTDRAIRGSLLKKTTFMCKHLDQNTLNASVFEPTCSGFSDSSAALRELTLKATLELVPKLTQPNLEKLSRYLVRLQGDTEPSIRTNTVIFFGKLASHLTEMSRHKLLLPAFVRAMKDPFAPCRLAALQSTARCKEWFEPAEIASRVLPAVTPQLLDPAAEVRREAFVVVDDFLFVMRQESERLNHITPPAGTTDGLTSTQTMNGTTAIPHHHHPPQAFTTKMPIHPIPVKPSQATLPAVVPPAAPKSTGYLSGISSWMTSSTSKTAENTPAQSVTTMTPPPPPTVVTMDASQRSVVSQQRSLSGGFAAPAPLSQGLSGMAIAAPMPVHDNHSFDNDDDGWDDDDDDLDLSGQGASTFTAGLPPAAAATTTSRSIMTPSLPVQETAVSRMAATQDDEDAFFGSFDVSNNNNKSTMSMKAIQSSSVRKPTAVAATGAKLVIPGTKKTAPTTITTTTTATTMAAPATAAFTKPAAPVVTKLVTDDSEGGDGWDDF